MITTEQGYIRTKTWIVNFHQALAEMLEKKVTMYPIAFQAECDMYENKIEELQEELRVYERAHIFKER